ncbi:hypothetical protein GGQ88_004029 [Novosphingobium hassiacum]|uniref:Uncharacterized protein n=1 Tax=Novosphingobium hassiacum TaxID=173676 RepID=A0A7W6EXU1_9SPHN|nr:hypothetical protein [Novosphingobium hassiacum]MBB3862727.1 hypothetical protein [Novosphingobium hassiacum]
MRKVFSCMVTIILSSASFTSPASGNNVGENAGWQFQTTADQVNKAYLEDMRQKKKNGYYAAPVYNTNIDKQYNCSVTSTATGNQSASTATGNSPSTTGHSASSTGNTGTTELTSSSLLPASANNSSDQSNSGSVSAGVDGNISTSVRGDTFQTLNTDQTNSGNQLASVTGATACQYGALNG